ncbi:MarR family winged helix-turn-helix transcriptional regulator [Vreelandella nigrificans]|uniref:MarR family transcriptional regulator n=1 Tax=Vreelandella nigrificans TaxID=2042704 RepID=A0A2A4HRL4_9GAMM|nr:MarR family transcriptional regulator [Halomonas nigrificans]PCF97572.1 MarR family transcriptional regulator [Halomonas nigrificans]
MLYRKHFGIGITEWRIIAMLAIEPNITATRIGDVIGFDKAAISRAIKSLRSQGIVNCQFKRNSKQQQIISLTELGESVHEEIIHVALAREEALLNGFSENEVKTFIKLLHKLHKNIEVANSIDVSDKESLIEEGLSCNNSITPLD